MIITLTPNPSVDRTVEVSELVRGAVLRATSAHVDPGGKGVNVSRALVANGCKTTAVLPTGGPEGAQLAALLEPDGIPLACVPIRGAVRANISVVEPDGTVTKLNEPGPQLSADEVAALVAATLEVARAGADWVVCSGSLPPGVSHRLYADLLPALHQTSVWVAVDSSGPALASALAAGPDLVKPNREELAEAAGHPVRTVGDAVAAAELLRARGAGTVLASLGADGAVLVDRSGAYHGEAAIDEPRGAVGAGDAMLAGFLAAGGQGRAALAEALAWGAAAASLPGSRMPGPADLHRSAVHIHPHLEQDRVLRERS
jgi:1-phosphofructokinase